MDECGGSRRKRGVLGRARPLTHRFISPKFLSSAHGRRLNGADAWGFVCFGGPCTQGRRPHRAEAHALRCERSEEMFIMDEIRENTARAIATPEFVRLRAGTRVSEAIRAVRPRGWTATRCTLFITDQEAAQGHAGDAHAAGCAGRRGRGGADGHGLHHRRDHGCRPAGGGALDAQTPTSSSLPVTDREGRLSGRDQRQASWTSHRGGGH